MLTEIASIILVYIAYLAFSARRLLTYMHAFQQEEYDEFRFLKWVFANKVFDKRVSILILLIISGAMWASYFSYELPSFATALAIFIAFTLVLLREKDPRLHSKKKLVMTTRATRIFGLAMAYAALCGTWIFFVSEPLLWIVPVQFMPFILILANLSLAPFELSVQKRYWNEAHTKIRAIKPTVIAVTGSFGKTSVKHILGHILKTTAPTLITPGSVNTSMGISRIIREDLEETHRYFIVEMGAYGPGSIKRLCNLAPPDMGVITAIGHAHYERFKSISTVARTKLELAESTIANSGKVMISEKALEADDYARDFQTKNMPSFVVCGEGKDNDLVIEDVKQHLKGMDVSIRYKNTPLVLNAPLFGLHHAVNIALAFAAARALDIPADAIQTALKSTPQISHRLEVKEIGAGYIIDDSYNSNPLGFRSALDLLSSFDSKQRKILVTPGMVEMGAAHDDVHDKIGRYAAEVCDVVVVINGKRIPTFVKGFKDNGGKALHQVKSFTDAQKWLDKNKQDSDVVLIENDLPDLYESLPKT